MLFRDGTFSRFRVRHPFLVALRGMFAGIGTVFGFYAFSVLPLADVYAIAFCVPIVVTLASIPLLGEKVGKYRFAAVVVGFVGVLIMVEPGVAPLSLGHAAAFGSVFTSTGVVLIMRRVAREEQRGVMVAAVMIGLLTVSIPGVVIVGRSPHGRISAWPRSPASSWAHRNFSRWKRSAARPSRALHRCSTRCWSGR